MKRLPYEIKVLLVSYLPTVGIHLILRPFWGMGVLDTNLAFFSVILTAFILPCYLLVINFSLAEKHKAKQFIINGLVMVSCVLISAYFHYINWADSTGLNGTDGETDAVINLEQWLGSAICVAGTLGGHYSLAKKKGKETPGGT